MGNIIVISSPIFGLILMEPDEVKALIEQQQQQMQQQQMSQGPDLTEVPVANENVSLNLMVGFLNIAQKRGAFNLKESSKIWECIKIFQKTSGPVGPEA